MLLCVGRSKWPLRQKHSRSYTRINGRLAYEVASRMQVVRASARRLVLGELLTRCLRQKVAGATLSNSL